MARPETTRRNRESSTQTRTMNPDTFDSRTTPDSQAARDDHLERLLDLALEETFPASDALALPLGADRAVTKSG